MHDCQKQAFYMKLNVFDMMLALSHLKFAKLSMRNNFCCHFTTYLAIVIEMKCEFCMNFTFTHAR